jgi:hypothetical protein
MTRIETGLDDRESLATIKSGFLGIWGNQVNLQWWLRVWLQDYEIINSPFVTSIATQREITQNRPLASRRVAS